MSISFGAAAIAASAAPHALDVAPGGLAFTLTYSDYQVEVNNGDSSPRVMATRWEWFVLPLTDHPQGDPFSVAVSGYAFVENGAAATLLISAGGFTEATRFQPGTDREYVQSLDLLTTGFDTQLRVAVGVIVEGVAEAGASLGVLSVDGLVKN